MEEIKKHPFFETINWENLKLKEIEPPFKPKVAGPKDLRYFDKMFTDEAPVESVPNQVMNSVQKVSNKYDEFTYRDPSQL